MWGQATERAADLVAAGELSRAWPSVYVEPRVWRAALHEARTLELHWETDVDGAPPGGNPFGWREPSLPPAPLGRLGEAVERWRKDGQRVVVTSDQSARLAELLEDAGVSAAPVAGLAAAPPPGGVALVERSLNGGFEGGPEGLVVLTDRELFGTVRVRRPRALRRVVPRDLLERLQPGDAVVHIDHGVARYAGLVRRSAGGAGDEERDFLELHFVGTDRMWVPVEQIDRLSRYAGDDQPVLSRLGGGEWLRTKARVKRAVTDLAHELLELYGARANAPRPSLRAGHALAAGAGGRLPLRGDARPAARRRRGQGGHGAPSSPWTAWSCGDVGYGKTEVALRAAFKAVLDGRQVAVLVPTTVLAQQHLDTFRERFAAYPVGVRMLSRFVPPAEQAQAVGAAWPTGSVDMVIGTHRLLSARRPLQRPGPRSSSTRSSASAWPTRSASSSCARRWTC